MIKDIPTKDDFDAIGCALLDQSWDTVSVLLLQLQEVILLIDDEDEEAYWRTSNTKLSTALAIAHQGAEFLLKGRIADVSPLLLIANTPREWPKPDDDGHIPFSKFRTVDAQDIVRLHNGCAAKPLDVGFARSLEALRVRRNAIMHSVDPNLKLNAVVLLEEILNIFKWLMPGRSWIEARRTAMSESSASQLWTSIGVDLSVVREFNAVKELLSAKSMLEHFGFDKKRRAYMCSDCTFLTASDEGFESFSATMVTKSPRCDELHCFICNESELVERKACSDPECKGDVISPLFLKCLTCGTSYEG